MSIWWDPKVVEMPSLELSRANKGGYQKPSWGRVSFAPDTYTGRPPRKATVNLDWGLTYSGSIHIFDGTIFLRRYTTQQLDYDIFEPEYETELLAEGTDTENNDVVQPLVVGAVKHMFPQRTGKNTEQMYYLPDFAGSIGNGINAYDDGVLINDNWTDNGDGTISRSVDLVGQLTFSGTGNMTTLIDIFSWACGELGLALDDSLADEFVMVDAVITNQQYVLDFLDNLAWYCDHGFYIREGTLCLISNDADNSSQSVGLGEGDFDPINITYEWPQPIKKISAKWQTRYAKVDEDGSKIDSEDHEVEVFSEFTAIGIEEDISRVYNFDDTKVKSKLQTIINRANLPQISLEIPLYRLPTYGERIDFVDLVNITPATGYVRCREVSLDYENKSAHIKGDGEVAFT
jgi:hypothetical protein